MAGILALLAFTLAVLFHGFRFAPNPWLDWTGLMLAGLALLAFHLLGGVPVAIRRRD